MRQYRGPADSQLPMPSHPVPASRHRRTRFPPDFQAVMIKPDCTG